MFGLMLIGYITVAVAVVSLIIWRESVKDREYRRALAGGEFMAVAYDSNGEFLADWGKSSYSEAYVCAQDLRREFPGADVRIVQATY